MNKQERLAVYNAASNLFGANNQMTVALGELAELQVEIAKHITGKRKDIKGLITELADARIMIEQIEKIYECEKQVTDEMAVKMQRLANYINNYLDVDFFEL